MTRVVRYVLPALTALAAFCQPTFFRDEEVKVVDRVEYGQTSHQLEYTTKPRYLAVHFQGKPGDQVDVRIDSINGQASAALTDSRYTPIVSGFGSHVVAVLPPGADPDPNEYYVVFQEERLRPANFTVTVQKLGENAAAAAAGYLTCRVDSDCVSVPREGCCHNGLMDAVNKNKIADYKAANACKLSNPMCPQFRVEEHRAAQCNFQSHQCELTEPTSIRCGGQGENGHTCPSGYTCKPQASGPGLCARP